MQKEQKWTRQIEKDGKTPHLQKKLKETATPQNVTQRDNRRGGGGGGGKFSGGGAFSPALHSVTINVVVVVVDFQEEVHFRQRINSK